MRRILLVLVVAAIAVVMTALAGPALAQVDIPPPGEDIPGKAEENAPQENPENFPATNEVQTEQGTGNCYGAAQREAAAGPGTEDPGSAADPTFFAGQEFFSGAAIHNLLDPGDISEFQETARLTNAACGQTA